MVGNITPRAAETLEQRLMRFFLCRIRRLAILDLYASAANVELLDMHTIGEFGQTKTNLWAAADPRNLLTGDPERDRQVVARLLKSSQTGAQRDGGDTAPADRIVGIPYEPDPDHETPARRAIVVAARAFHHIDPVRPVSNGASDSRPLLSLVRSFLPPPDVTRVAVALLVARAVGSSLAGMADLRDALSRPDPFILIKAPVGGFEHRFGQALEEGIIVPFWAKLADLFHLISLSNRYDEKRRAKKRRKVAVASGKAIAKSKEAMVRRQISNILCETHLPVMIADETDAALMSGIVETADLVLECGPLDEDFLASLLSICCGIPVKETLRQFRQTPFDLSRLHLDDLTLAVRQGRSVDTILTALEILARPIASEGDSEARDGKSGGGKRKGMDTQVSVDIIQPDAVTEDDKSAASLGSINSSTAPVSKRSAPALRVETLAGYGDATSWAMDLKTDLAEWRAGEIDWSDMSTKLLLSGPPGTGKTTFARALCNSLRVPVVISSVTSWLEPGYLGDVLQRMSAAFKAARDNAPCILLIDELDGIGSRAGGGDRNRAYDDYWTSLVNRLLELLDGALKSEGVIVVAATNFPERIDPALLRSGRLEKHVVIPMPDVDALTGILAHHLGGDLDHVLTTVPVAIPTSRSGQSLLRPPAAKNATPIKVRQPPSEGTADPDIDNAIDQNRRPLHD
jgi:cell division protease FtsH